MKFTENKWGLRARRSKLLVRYGCFLEVFHDGRRSGGRQPALRRPGALRRRTTGSPTADSFVSHVQYLLLRNRFFFFHGSESKCLIAPATDAQDRRQNINTVHKIFYFSARIRLRGALSDFEKTEIAWPKSRQPRIMKILLEF